MAGAGESFAGAEYDRLAIQAARQNAEMRAIGNGSFVAAEVENVLPDLLKRFDTITLKILQRHGIEQAGFWTVVVGESNQDLYYLLAWESLAERETKWAAFMADPEWIAKRADTERDGAIVASITNAILQPPSFSSVR